MWREESGFLEMFLAYYGQFEENVVSQKAYRDFLFDIICAHEMSLKLVYFDVGLSQRPWLKYFTRYHDFTLPLSGTNLSMTMSYDYLGFTALFQFFLNNFSFPSDSEEKNASEEIPAQIVPSHFLPPEIASRLEIDLRSASSSEATGETWKLLCFASQLCSIGVLCSSRGEEGGGASVKCAVRSGIPLLRIGEE